MKPTKEIIVYKEGLWQSIVSDTYTFGVLMGCFILNHYATGGSNFVNGVLVIMLVISGLGKAAAKKNTFYTIEEVVKHLESKS